MKKVKKIFLLFILIIQIISLISVNKVNAANAFISRDGNKFMYQGSQISFTGYQVPFSECSNMSDADLSKMFDDMRNTSKANLARFWFYELSYEKDGFAK